jgi:hypothetical protein
MTPIAADLYELRLRWATEGLGAMLTAHGPARTVAWARAGDEETKLAALAVFEQVPLALKLLADLERARQSGNPTKVAKVNRRLDRLLEPNVSTYANGSVARGSATSRTTRKSVLAFTGFVRKRTPRGRR